MSGPKPTRSQGDLAEMLETLLDKGVVINADIAVTIGDTELLGVQVRAAVASFETAAQYGLAFPSGTDMERVEAAAGVDAVDGERAAELGDAIDATDGGERPTGAGGEADDEERPDATDATPPDGDGGA
jgi:hypothetical protein